MDRVILPIVFFAVLFTGCSVTPEEHRDLAFRKYSLDCVARGIAENTQAHTQCVVDKYEKFTSEQRRGEDQMRDLYAEKEPEAVVPAASSEAAATP